MSSPHRCTQSTRIDPQGIALFAGPRAPLEDDHLPQLEEAARETPPRPFHLRPNVPIPWVDPQALHPLVR
jgi:hypothetical protein